MIKAVIFDVDGVLIDSFEANLKFYQSLMTKTGYKPPTREEFPTVFHLSLYDSIRALTKSNSEEVERIWKIAKDRGVEYPTNLLSMPNGSKEVIDALSKKYLLGIVTSRIRESVFESPELKTLEKYFKVVVSYQDTENHKPHPDPLLLAIKSFGVKPEQSVYIGDAENDIKAGKSAGMKVILYSKSELAGSDAVTSSFKSLPEIIASMNSS